LIPSQYQASPGARSPRRGEQAPGAVARRGPRPALALFAISVGALILFGGFVALGTWQLKRLGWKLDLIARVERRVHAPAVVVPAAAQWSELTAVNDEYRRVRATGTFLNESETLVQAATELGAGFWVLTPLQLADGSVVLINRGFVPPDRRDRAVHGAGEPATPATVTGLLRMTEPGGAFLRRNNPGTNHWYSRDVQAIAAARGLRHVAPYFVDAEEPDVEHAAADAASMRAVSARAAGDADNDLTDPAGAPVTATGRPPVGGLTIISFHNNHLIYSITWYTLAFMVAGGMWIVVNEEHRLRRGSGSPDRLP
jgi:surfeit locus 1 family protein